MSLAVHNVVQLSDAEVRDRFVIRGRELEELLGHLHEPDPPRHALVVGPRGMGKSLLLRRLAVAVAEDLDLARRWLPVLMAEELYEVTSVGELWLAALARLAEVVGDGDLATQHRALLAEPDPSRVETLALQRLLAAARARGLRVLLLIENLDMLLGEQVSSQDGWSLRQALQTEPELLVIASAVTRFTQVEDADEALYGFFHRLDLGPLDDGEVRTLWREVTGVDLDGDRAVPIRILTGGNPRLITVLGRFSRHPDLGGLRRDLELLIDEYTPFFKANIEALPAVERKVFVTLADIWAPATAAEVAQAARLDTSKVSALLGRLVRRGAVEIVDEEPGRRRYELTERLYNIYHLLRRPGGDGRVRALVDILVHLYEPAQLEHDIWPNIVHGPSGPMSEMDLAIASRLHRHREDAGVWDDLPQADLPTRLSVLESLVESQRATLGDDDPDTLLTRLQIASCIGVAGDVATALAHHQRILIDMEQVLGPDHLDTLTCRDQVAYYTGVNGDPTAALTLFRQIAADSERVFGPDHRRTLRSRYQVAYYTGVTNGATALTLYHQVTADSERVLGADHPDTLRSRHRVAYYTGLSGDPEVALTLYQQLVADRARVLGVDHPDTLRSRYQVAYYTGLSGDSGAAITLYRQLTADCDRVLGPDHPDTLRNRYQVAYYLSAAGDAGGAFEMVDRLLRDLEGAVADRELVAAARTLEGQLELRMAAASGRRLPRELQQASDALSKGRRGDA